MMGFVNKNFEDVLTCTRASTATYVDPTGIIRTAGANVPRFTFENGEGKGLLVEEQRANLLTWSEDFSNAAWTEVNTTVSSNAITAPDGTLTADKLVATTSNAEHHLFQVYSTNVGTFSISCFAKAGEYNTFVLRPVHTGANEGNTTRATFILEGDGDIVSVDSHATASIKKYPNGWYRCNVTLTITGSITALSPLLQLNNGSGTIFTGDGTSGIYIWGSQLEQGSTPSSYIPTQASAVTRVAEQISISLA